MADKKIMTYNEMTNATFVNVITLCLQMEVMMEKQAEMLALVKGTDPAAELDIIKSTVAIKRVEIVEKTREDLGLEGLQPY